MELPKKEKANRIFTLGRAGDFLGQEVGLSGWLTVSQERVDAFAEVSQDHQWIHQDSPLTRSGPFAGPIAHGLLLLPLSLQLARDSGALPKDTATCIIYGCDKVRFQAQVRIGKQVRCRTTLIGVKELGPRKLLTVRLKLEVEDENLPAMVADCLLLCLP